MLGVCGRWWHGVWQDAAELGPELPLSEQWSMGRVRTVYAEGHLVNAANGQGMAPHEQSPPGDGREHSRLRLRT